MLLIKNMFNPTRIDTAVKDFIEARRAARKSERTLVHYQYNLSKFATYVGPDRHVHTITPADVREFLSAQTTVGDKTVLAYHTALSALYTYLVSQRIVGEHIMRSVEPPDPEDCEVVPFTKEEVTALILACDLSKPYRRGKQRTMQHATQNAKRDRAVIYVLLDTGLRVTELVTFTVADMNINGIKVLGKGKKERWVPMSPTTHDCLWMYLDTRKDLKKNDVVFPVSRSGVLQACKRLEKRSGVSDVHPHRFRHTFAITFLRNGGDPWTLQKILGHSTMDMVKKYLAIVRADLERIHAKASPVENWGL